MNRSALPTVSPTAFRSPFLVCLLAVAALAACGDDAPSTEVDAGRNPGSRDTGTVDGGDAGTDDAGADAIDGDANADDTSGDASVTDTNADAETDVAENPCDRDNDGFEDAFCGGPDCDDTNRNISPNAMERCDAIDNNCSGENNEGINCSFFAHTQSDLYEVDPFRGVDQQVISTPGTFLDFDTDRDGVLWGITSSTLYRFDGAARQWTTAHSLASFSSTPNGFAISSTGEAFATGGNDLYSMNLSTGDFVRVGQFGGGYESSGDCVTDKSDQIFMSSKRDGQDDLLVSVNGATGEAVTIGSIGFRSVYGLTSAWGYLFGLTSSGQLIEIDPTTGAGTLWHTFEGRRWYGSASTPGR